MLLTTDNWRPKPLGHGNGLKMLHGETGLTHDHLDAIIIWQNSRHSTRLELSHNKVLAHLGQGRSPYVEESLSSVEPSHRPWIFPLH